MRSEKVEIMQTGKLKDRTRAFALGVIRFVDGLPRTTIGRVIGNQLLRSGTSVAANYRAATRARSRREFIAKLGIVEEEGDETLFWIDLAVDAALSASEHAKDLRREANEIVAMVVSSIRTARGWRRATPHSALSAPRSSCS